MGRHSAREDEVTMMLPTIPVTGDLPEPARESNHVVRSHRRPPSPFTRPIILAVILLVSAVPILSMRNATVPASVALSVPVTAPVKAAKATDALLPTLPAFPPPKPVTKPVAVTVISPKPATPLTKSKVEQVIAFAMAQVGERYQWAASGPNSWDCSGLVMMAFKQIGISLPHFTGDIIKKGKAINRASMLRGDVFFPTSSHVGIYLGNNTFIAANVGGVSVQSIYSFYAARRLV